MNLKALVPQPIKPILRPIYRRLAPRPAAAPDADGEIRARLIEQGFLQGYGVPPEHVTTVIRIKDDSAGEPERAGTYTRAGLEMKDYELLFTLKSLCRHVPPGGSVMDVASGSSLLPAIFASVGFKAVHHDVHPLTYADPGIEPLVCDVLELADRWAAESLDAVTLICAMEHFGLGRYGDLLDGRGDFRAMEQIRAVLKPGGVLVLTVPYGKPALVFNAHRIYDRSRLARILEGFEVLEEEYRVWPDWRLTSPAEAEDYELTLDGKRAGKNFSLALWAARKR